MSDRYRTMQFFMLFLNMISKARKKWCNRKNTVMAPDFAVDYDPYIGEIAAFASK